MKHLVFCLLLVTGMLPVAFSQAYMPQYVPGKLWVRLEPGSKIASSLKTDPENIPVSFLPGMQELASRYQITKIRQPFFAAKESAELLLTYELQFDDIAGTASLIRDLERMSSVQFAERVPLNKPALTPNDPSYGSQWGLSVIGAASAWNYFSTGATKVIAIVDDAIARTHNDLSPNLWVNPGEIPNNNIDDDNNGYVDDVNGYDVGSNDNNPNPPSNSYDHGTHVAGIASAATNNGTGVASIGFSCKLMCVKATNTPGLVTHGYEGIVYAAASGAHIINCSWGGSSSSSTGQSVINYANSRGCIVVAAAGNDNVNYQFYPAAFNGVIAVAATNSNDTKASFSNYGSWIDISAPGNNIYSTTVGNTYGNKSGTSMASPMVAGLLGLMWSYNPGMTKTDVVNCLLNNATNIHPQNPGYINMLGAGRINAPASMLCIQGQLSAPPVADFTSNITTVTAGGMVQFTDLSYNNPTTWNWSFPGGTPSSFTGQNPPAIVYNTPGVYNVQLTATNSNGPHTVTRNGYITVNAAGGCHTINLPVPQGWTLSNYYTGSFVGQDGWINGVNVYLDRQKAMYFDASSQPYNYMVQVYIAFGLAYSANPAKVVPVRVYDGTSGSPGTQIGSGNLTMGQIMSDVSQSFYSQVIFSSPITLPPSKRFFVSVDLTNLQWTTNVKDTLSIVSNSAGQTVPSAIWEQQSNNQWFQYTTPGSWNLSASLLVHPFLTNEPVNATFTASSYSICAGDFVQFDNTGSTFQDTLLWVFPGGNPGVVSSNPAPSINFPSPGTYTVTMYVVGGGCGMLDSAQASIVVAPTPSVSITASQNTICQGQSTNLQASGASSYQWSPPTGLSTTTGPSVTASPPGTTTYTVTGTTGSCSGTSNIQVTVENQPVASFVISDTVIDCGDTILVDGSASQDVSAFSWSFTGGNPAVSNSSGQEVSYNASGTFPAYLIVSNSCGADTATFQVTVQNCNLGTEEAATTWSLWWQTGELYMASSGHDVPESVYMTDISGRIVAVMAVNASGNGVYICKTPLFRAGMYICTGVSGDGKTIFSRKMVFTEQ